MQKHTTLFVFLFVLVGLLMFLPTSSAQARSLFETQPADPLADLFTALKSLTGVSLLISALINALKTTGIIKNGDAPAWSVGFNLAGMILLFALQLLGKADLVPVLNAQAGGLSQVLTALVAFAYQIFVTRMTHENVLSGLPVIGKSYSGRAAGSGASTESP
jgi:hypothetical protein